MAAIELRGVNKIHPNGFHAVKDVSLHIGDGEFMVLVGPSGCAKSTTLNMIAGLEEITSGQVLIDGRVVNDLPAKDRDVAMVFQSYALYPHMSVFDNMAFGLKLRRTPKKEIRKKVHEAAELLGISELLTRRPKALSGGQRQRVALGRAIVRDPKVFLFDEPLSNLDAKLRAQMRVELAKLHSKLKATVVYVTHDQVEAMSMGSRICVMNQGRIEQVDAPVKIYNHPGSIFTATFIGSPTMNLAEVMIRRRSQGAAAVLPEGRILPLPHLDSDKAAALDGRSVTLGLRPEHIRVGDPEAGSDGTVSARAELVERIGSEAYVYFLLDGRQFIAAAPAEADIGKGRRLAFTFVGEKAHFFDPQTGLALFPERRP